MTEPRRFGKYSKVIRELEDTIKALCQQMELIVAEKDAEIEQLKMEKPVTDAQIKYMVDRFLNYKLPENWKPDGGISFEKYGNKGTPHQYARNPVGTNLLDADQATAMVRHMIEELPRS
jgi:hypothetical protein